MYFNLIERSVTAATVILIEYSGLGRGCSNSSGSNKTVATVDVVAVVSKATEAEVVDALAL